MAIAAYRSTELLVSDHAFLAVKDELEERRIGKDIAMPALQAKDVAAYLDRIYENHEFPDDLAEVIHRQTAGNPLFMADLVRDIQSRDLIESASGAWLLTRPVEEACRALPKSIRSMIERKVEGLDPQDRELLSAAAVQGFTFESVIVADALDLSAVAVEDRLLELDRKHSLIRSGGEVEMPDGHPSLRSQFCHILYQNELIDSLTPSRRLSLAASVADSLAARYASRREEIALDLAALFEDARQTEKAARYYLEAAENNVRLHAFDEASALAERAYQATLKLPKDEQGPLLLEHAFLKIRMSYNQGLFEEIPDACRAAEQLALLANDAEARVDVVCTHAIALFYLKRLTEADQEAARALELARDTKTELAIASAEAAVALIRLSFGDLAKAETYFDRAIPVIRAKNPRPHTVDAIGYRLLLHAWRLEYREVETASEWIRESSLRAGNTLCSILFSRSMASGNRGQLAEALQFAEEGRKLAELNEDRYFISRMPNVLGWLAAEAHNVKASLALNEESIGLAQSLGFEEAEANGHVNLAALYSGLGELQRASEHIQTAERLFEEDIWFRWRYNIRLQATKAGICIAGGDLEAAAAYAQTSLDLARSSLARKHVSVALKLQGDIAALEDRIDESVIRYRDSLQCLSENPCPTVEWRTSLSLANSLQKKGMSAEAEILTDRAKKHISALGNSLADDALRRTFFAEKTARDLGVKD